MSKRSTERLDVSTRMARSWELLDAARSSVLPRDASVDRDRRAVPSSPRRGSSRGPQAASAEKAKELRRTSGSRQGVPSPAIQVVAAGWLAAPTDVTRNSMLGPVNRFMRDRSPTFTPQRTTGQPGIRGSSRAVKQPVNSLRAARLALDPEASLCTALLPSLPQ